jgi:hypothetical protein
MKNDEDSESSGAERRSSSPSRPGGGALHRASPFVVAGRYLLLFLAAAALVASIVRTRAHDRAALATTERYVCPMHPEVQSSTPGDCPICNMALVPMRQAERTESRMTAGGQVVATAETRTVARLLRAAAWIGKDGEGTALLYKDDLVDLAPEEPARFFGSEAPNLPLTAHLRTAEQEPVDSSTVHVRFRLDPATPQPSPGDVGSLQMDVRARRLLVVPTSAVLYSAGGPYVLAASHEGEGFTKRTIQVGRVLDSGYVGVVTGSQEGGTVVLSGLREGERVIAGYSFFADVDRRLSEARGEERMR